MKHVAGFPNSAGTRTTVFALLRVQSPGSAAAAAEQMSTNAVSTPRPHLAYHSVARPTVVGFMAAAFDVTLGLGVKTAI
jgi:hypothetical protein